MGNIIADSIEKNQKHITITESKIVGFKNWVTIVLYLSRLNPWVAKAETSVSELKGIAIANTINTDVKRDV
tara:strand:+ start:565 stop:777 length:213 start_codon:yes stop_codon:yes gene_type:complete